MILTEERTQAARQKIQDAVEAALVSRNVSARRASLDVVGNDGLIRDIRAGVIPSADRLQALFDYLGLDFSFGPKQPVRGLAEDGSSTDLHRVEAMRAGYLPIPWHDPVAGSGSAPVALDNRWLAENAVVPDHLSALIPDLTFLEHALQAAPLVVLDSMGIRKGGPHAWCFREAGRNILALLQFDADVTLMLPASRNQPIRVLPKASAAITILGRAVWIGGLV